jgi:hypothetical protein
MRIIFGLVAVIVFLGWLGFELRDRHNDLSQGLFALSILLAILLVAAVFGLYEV